MRWVAIMCRTSLSIWPAGSFNGVKGKNRMPCTNGAGFRDIPS